MQDLDSSQYAEADRREVNPPIEVESATWSLGGTLDWWVRERREWFGRVRSPKKKRLQAMHERIGLGDGETALRNGGLDNVQRASANTDPVRDAPFARSPSALAWLHTYVFAGQTTTRRDVQLARHLLRVQGRPRPPRIHTSLHSPRLEADRGLLDLIVAEILPMRTSKSRASGRAAGGAQQQRVRATKSENPP